MSNTVQRRAMGLVLLGIGALQVHSPAAGRG